jgi:HPt (histidine-containing phosphotransfer) domain-containing protein
MDILATFGTESPKKLDELTRCLNTDDIPLYTIHIHALKSACANIGADALSQDAENLENAGLENDTQFIQDNHKTFAENIAKIISNVNQFVSAAVTEKPSANQDDTAMYTSLAELKTALEAFDISAIDEISESLQNYKSHPAHGKELSEILRLAFVSKYKDAVARINNILTAV